MTWEVKSERYGRIPGSGQPKARAEDAGEWRGRAQCEENEEDERRRPESRMGELGRERKGEEEEEKKEKQLGQLGWVW
jgi:hypothetical protein